MNDLELRVTGIQANTLGLHYGEPVYEYEVTLSGLGVELTITTNDPPLINSKWKFEATAIV